MALQKQNINISFGQGIQTNVDPLQLPAGKMIALVNAIFNKAGLLTKRNGYGALPTLPDATAKTVTTYAENLLALGKTVQVLSEETGQWLDRGAYDPVQLSVLPLVRTSAGQTTVDVAVSEDQIACSVFVDTAGVAAYQISDATSGQIFASVTNLPTGAKKPRVYILGRYFVITFLITIGTVHLQYIAIPLSSPNNPIAAVDLSTQVSSLSGSYDGCVNNNNLYLALNGSDAGGAIRITYLDSALAQHNTAILAGRVGDVISLSLDTSQPTGNVFVTFKDTTAGSVYVAIYTANLLSVVAATVIGTASGINLFTTAAQSGVLTVFYQYTNTYSYSSVRSDYLVTSVCTVDYGTSTLSVTSTDTILRGVGLASKPFYHADNGKIYVMVAYSGSLQPTYFLSDQKGNLVAKLAYSNAGGYAATELLPNVNINGDLVQIGYLFKDIIVPVNVEQGALNPKNIYTQTGINLVNFNLSSASIITSEVAGSLHMTGGFYWQYDGNTAVEHGFHVFPEDIGNTTATTTGFLSAQVYYYWFVYEWTDAKGLVHRSAPSIPLKVDLSASGTSTNKNTLHVPTLRLTYKGSINNVRLVGYRWSTAQQIAYQFTSITSPTLNDKTVDSVDVVDTLADASILGNLILYITGKVVENIAAPSASCSTLFQSRVVLIPSEDENSIWFSKTIKQNTPVEFSDLLTRYITPTLGTQGTSGPNKVVAAMDDKLIIWKKQSIYYMTGQGPDDTGRNNDFSEPVFITNAIGCGNPQSVVLVPQGLMFETDKGIWLLGRDLSIKYIGDAVSDYNGSRILSSCTIPETNQVRFILDTGVTLLYDYFFDQWSVFKGCPGGSSTIYRGRHTYLNSRGQVFSETPGLYLDGSRPVLISFTTAWLKLMGLQGYQRAYFFYLLGKYLSPHKLQIQVAYDGNSAAIQQSLISPDNYSPAWGGDSSWGSSSPWGGPSNMEPWRVFLDRQKCEMIQITCTEIYDPSYGVAPGAGIELSGINLVVSGKATYPKRQASQSVG